MRPDLALVARVAMISAGSQQAKSLHEAVYSPYPAGLLPADIESEANRVNTEIDQLEQEAMAEWRALPKNSGTAMRQIQLVGKIEMYDKNLSVNRNEACAFCHMPYTAFSGPISSLNATTVAYPGSVRWRFGKRKPPGYTYSPYYPVLQYNQAQSNFYGGNFWDLRATGYRTQSPDAEQAQDPPHDTQEMGLPDTACVVYRISTGAYADVFTSVWGAQAFAIDWPKDTEKICITPGGAFGINGTPIDLKPQYRGLANATYDEYALSITSYESSPDVSPFSSKFDAALASPGKAILTADEQAGWDLFRGKAKCNTCHLDGTQNSFQQSTAGNNGTTAARNASSLAPLFTDFTSSNLGVPRNPSNPYYSEDKPDVFGFVANPAGPDFTDLGVGLFLRGKSGVLVNSEWAQYAKNFDGAMQVSTLRNVDMRPYPGFVKAYMHNGYLKSLKEVVHFYNTRDLYKVAGVCPAGTEKLTCWPPAEVSANVDTTVGNLGLSDKQEDQIVKFMQTLTDGYMRPYTDAGSFRR
ncbi:MAG TPA: cytochrome c peroxidase [Bryobacteraceae bacterium]